MQLHDMNMRSLTKTAIIISNKAFQRLAEKTQVVHPKNGRNETVQNRLTHSYEVANSSAILCEAIKLPNLEIDYQKSIHNVSLLHDIGHPPFGHEGATFLDSFFKELGLKEGFSDNNNNFVIIQKNQFDLDDYDVASLIKYPERLYKYQSEQLIRKLKLSIDQDIEHFESKIKIFQRPRRTLACEIMDEADRNSYVTSDLSDCFSLKFEAGNELEELLETNKFYSHEIKEFLILIVSAIKDHNKSLIKRAFNNLKIILNKNYYLGNNLCLEPINQELILLREDLFAIEKKIFIHSKEVLEQREIHIKYLEDYAKDIVENKVYPSTFYSKKILNSTDPEETLRYMRDMIAETTDWYVINSMKKEG